MEIFLPLDSPPCEAWVRIPFPVPAYLTLRAAGDMRRDGEGRGRFYRSVGLDAERVHVVGQVHSRTVVVVPADADGGERTMEGEHFTPNADGMITGDPDAVLGVTVAFGILTLLTGDGLLWIFLFLKAASGDLNSYFVLTFGSNCMFLCFSCS